MQRALKLVLSAALTKLSRRESDTTLRTENKRIAGGFSIRFFVKKAADLGRRLLEFSALLPGNAPLARTEPDGVRFSKGVRIP